MTGVSLEVALALVQADREEAPVPMAIAVVDTGGALVAFGGRTAPRSR